MPSSSLVEVEVEVKVEVEVGVEAGVKVEVGIGVEVGVEVEVGVWGLRLGLSYLVKIFSCEASLSNRNLTDWLTDWLTDS